LIQSSASERLPPSRPPGTSQPEETLQKHFSYKS
jgi:hypothetical protein